MCVHGRAARRILQLSENNVTVHLHFLKNHVDEQEVLKPDRGEMKHRMF